MGCRNLTDAAHPVRRGGSDSTVTRALGVTGEALLAPVLTQAQLVAFGNYERVHCDAMWRSINCADGPTNLIGGFVPSDTDRDTANPTSLELVCSNIRRWPMGHPTSPSMCEFASQLVLELDFDFVAFAHDHQRICNRWVQQTRRHDKYTVASVSCCEHQVRHLRQIAKRRGWDVVETYSDEGISDAKCRKQRPGLDAMLNDASRRKFDVVMV